MKKFIARFLPLIAVSSVAVLCRAQTNTAWPSSGSVGIGTTTPSTLLYLKQTSVGNPAYTPVLGMGYDDSMVFGGSLGLRVVPGNFRQGLKISSNLNLTFHSPVATSNAAFQWQTGTVSGANEATDANAVMTLTGAGNLGIGIAAPSAKLHIFQASGGYNHLLLDTGFGGGNAFALNPFITGISNGGFELRDATNNAARLVVQQTTGNVGIGTTNPSQKLEIVSSGSYASVAVGNGISASYFGYAQATGNYNSNSLPGDAIVRGQSGVSIAGGNGGVGGAGIRVDTLGNVGIGTTSPVVKFQVVQNITEWTGDFKNYAANAYGLRVDLSGSSGNNAALQVYTATGGGMIVRNDGNVGIGTITPTHKLSVNGTIRAKEVIVDTGWSDYVFAADYALAPLSEVEAHIKAHHTLPGVPSEAQVAKEGISVGEMQAKLLAKVEELTLYVIDLKKENAALKAAFAEIKSSPLSK